MLPRGVLVYLTDGCFLDCKHCGIVNKLNPKFIDLDIMKSTLEFFNKNRVYIIAYSGGDPLLHPHIFEILELTRSFGMLPVLGISGVHLNDEVIKKIALSKVGCVQVSLDGSTEFLNSQFRGKGTFNTIVDNIIKMNRRGINVNIATCIVKENLYDLTNILNLFLKLNAYKVKIQFWENIKSNIYFNELTNEEKKTVIETATQFQNIHKKSDWIVINQNFDSFKINSLRYKKKMNRLIVLPNGDVTTGEGKNIIGNILKDQERIERSFHE